MIGITTFAFYFNNNILTNHNIIFLTIFSNRIRNIFFIRKKEAMIQIFA